MSLCVGVISYLPDFENRHRRRQLVHTVLRELWKRTPEGVPITVIAQNYRDGDELELYDLEYIHYSEGLGGSKARNILLERFYNSDYDFMLYTDDDTSFYDRYSACDLLQNMHDNPSWFSDIDCIKGLEGRFTPFTEKNSKMKLDTTWVFEPMQFTTSGELRILRNLKKYSMTPIYYDESRRYGEDLDFRLRYLSKLNSFCCRNLILTSRGLADGFSTLDTFSKTEQELFYEEVTSKVLADNNVPLGPRGRPIFTDFLGGVRKLVISIDDGNVIEKISRSRAVRLF